MGKFKAAPNYSGFTKTEKRRASKVIKDADKRISKRVKITRTVRRKKREYKNCAYFGDCALTERGSCPKDCIDYDD